MLKIYCLFMFAVLVTVLLPAPGRGTIETPTAVSPRVFSHPDRIRYDSQCFTIEGKDTFIFSGAFHYFRCPKELWNDRFDKIQAAGFNAVETYVAWNAAEPTMPASLDDYSKVDLKDLDDWLTMAEAHGLYVILRPGPYICAEWDCGGFPQWLITKRPPGYRGLWLRSDEPTFVAWSKHWFHAVDQIAVKHQLTHRSTGTRGIILYQLENEYGHRQPYDVETRYLHALGKQAIDDGIDVPLFTCWTEVVRGNTDPVLRQVYDTCNFYPRWNVDSIAGKIAQLQKEQPDAPLQTTELQGGWFSNPGNAASLSKSWTDVIDSLSPSQIQNLTLYAIEKGDRAMNYYMLFGGTNFGDMAPQNITTSYDYSAPIRELGCVGEKYQRVAAIGAMLREHGERLARAHPYDFGLPKTTDQDVAVSELVAPDQSRYYFVRTNQHAEGRKGKLVFPNLGEKQGPGASYYYELEPFGSMILYFPPPGSAGPAGNGGGAAVVPEWLPKPVVERKRPTDGLPLPINLSVALTKTDPGPVQWEPLKDGQSLEQMGIYDRRFVFYRTHLDTGLDMLPAMPIFNVSAPSRDNLLTFVDGKFDSALGKPGGHKATKIDLGINTINMIYENVGQPNGGRGMEEMAGIRKIELLTVDATISDWRMKKITRTADGKFQPDQLPELSADTSGKDWAHLKIKSPDDATQLTAEHDAVFRGTVNLTADQLKAGDLNIQMSRMDDDGWVFINGKKIGEGHEWSESFTFPATGLHEGDNSIAVVVQNHSGPGGLGLVKLTSAKETPSLPIEIGKQSTGFAQQWWKSDLDEKDWTTTPIDQPATDASKLAWSRFKFELPEVKKGIWVPWVARLTTNGNGFLYLNNHALGRYWQAGPQHDFFLPECWLNFGSGSKNVLTMCLRSVDGKPVAIESAQIVPVNEVAEYRP
jgi:hypothetical protein